MKVLLIHPDLHRVNVRHYNSAIEKQRGIYPPLGLGYIASSLLHNGHQVEIIDCGVESNPQDKVTMATREFQPELVGFHTMTWTFAQANELLKVVKKIRPEVVSVVGGPNVTSFPSFALEASKFDFGVHGEGEVTIVELINAIEESTDLKDVPGISYRDNGHITVNIPRTYIDDLDQVSFPSWQLLPVSQYYDVFTRHKRFATMIATRGCPFNCTFCDRPNRMGKKWRTRSPENVVEEIEYLVSNFGIKEIMFFDDNFIIDHTWIYELCEEMLRRNVAVDWECRARVDMVNQKLLQTMKHAGCYRIRYGMESGDNEILKVLKKDITVEQSLECARISKEAGMEVFAYFMMGSPYETLETLKKTSDLALKVDGDFTAFSKTILIIGSELFDWAVQNNYISKDYWKDFLLGNETNTAPALSTTELTEEVVDEYIAMANKRFYMRPKYIWRRLRNMRSFGQLYHQFKMARGLL